jgi:estrone sulfotransferase
MTSSRMKLLALYALGFAGMRAEDIILASFPRSGSTWVRFVLCNLISLREWNGKEVEFALLNETMPALGANTLLRRWPHSTIPRVVKTHKRYLPIFRRNRSIGIIRDPRDVMVSFYHYQKDRRRTYAGSFAEFLRDEHLGLENWFRHYTSWRNHWTLVVRYEDLRRDSLSGFRHILSMLGTSVPEDSVREAIRRSSLEEIRGVEATVPGSETKNARFARNGGIRQWLSYFSEEDLTYCDALLERFEVDLWMHGEE